MGEVYRNDVTIIS